MGKHTALQKQLKILTAQKELKELIISLKIGIYYRKKAIILWVTDKAWEQ